MKEIIQIGKKAKQAAYEFAHLDSDAKNSILSGVAEKLIQSSEQILEENKKDLISASEMGLKGAIVERLTLDQKKIEGIAEGLIQIAGLDDPVGEVMEMKKRPN